MHLIKIIKLDKSIFSELFIELPLEFKTTIFEELCSIYTIAQMAKLANVSEFMVRSWKTGDRPIKYAPFSKLCQSINLPERVLINQSLFFKTRLSAGKVKIKNELMIDEPFAELIGFAKGDGCIHKKYLELSNNCLNTVFYYVNTLVEKFGLDKNQIEVTIMTTHNCKRYPEKEVNYSRKQGYNRIIIRQRKLYSREPTIRCRLNSKIAATIFNQIKSGLYTIFEDSPKNIRRSFIRGYAAAEGSVGERRISLSQKNVKELFFLQKVLLNLGYKSVKSFSKNKNKLDINIYRYSDLNRYCKEIGFGPNDKRNKKLKNLLNAYSQFTHVPKQQNYRKILNIVQKLEKTDGSKLSRILKKSYKETSRLLKELVNLGYLKVNCQHKPYIYSLSKDFNGSS